MTRFVSGIPFIGSICENVARRPFLRRGIDEIKLAIMYRQLFPNAVVLPNSGSPIFVDRNENRGRSVLLCGASGQPNLKALWHRAVEVLCPDVVVDVGANYGEFVFGERYPKAKRILSIEANEGLATYLQMSHKLHPDRERMTILTALAAGRSDDVIEFFLDQGSSGRSTAVKRTDTKSVVTRVRTVAVDDLLEDLALEEMKLIFKIDVEGFEPVVFEGMKRVIERTNFLLGLIEFNPRLIRLSGVDPQRFLDSLHSRLQIVALPHRGKPYKLSEGTLEEITEIEGVADFEIDLLLHSRIEDRVYENSLIEQILGQR